MIAFRTTAGKAIGFGHLRRCLTLAGELRTVLDSAPIRFWIDGDQRACSLANAAGYETCLVSLAEPAGTDALIDQTKTEVLIADSYTLTETAFSSWHLRLRCLVVVDDLADRFIDADAVLNGSPYAQQLRYRAAPDCQFWLGPEYALLRPVFRGLAAREISASVRRVLVTLGGADPQGSITAVVAAVQRALPATEMDVVIGPLFGPVPELDVLATADDGRIRVLREIDDMAPLMLRADIAISGGGQTLYELAASGVPTIAICMADNQQGNIAALANRTLLIGGAVREDADWSQLEGACHKLAADPGLRRSLSSCGQALVDGKGALRVADMIRTLALKRGAFHGQ